MDYCGTFLTATAIGTNTASAQSSDRYIGIDLIASTPSNIFNGYNTVGAFDNSDNQSEKHVGIALTYGARDLWDWNGTTITPEIELAWFNDYSTVSASSPGLPAPTFFYRSNIQTGRLGVNLKAQMDSGADWRTEFGVGLGAVYREFSTNDTVVQGSTSSFTPYGKIGLRYLKDINTNGRLSIGLNVVVTGNTDIAISSFGPTPAGNLSVRTVAPEIRIGYQFLLGK